MEDTTPRVAALLKSRLSPPLVPATFFGMVLGLGGLGNGWRAAARVWNVPDLVGEVLSLSAVAVWLTWRIHSPPPDQTGRGMARWGRPRRALARRSVMKAQASTPRRRQVSSTLMVAA